MLSIPAYPIKVNRRALKDKCKKEGNAVANHHASSRLDNPAYSRVGEDTQVEEKKADFGKSDGGDIKQLLDIENLLRRVRSTLVVFMLSVPYLEDLRDFVEF